MVQAVHPEVVAALMEYREITHLHCHLEGQVGSAFLAVPDHLETAYRLVRVAVVTAQVVAVGLAGRRVAAVQTGGCKFGGKEVLWIMQ